MADELSRWAEPGLLVLASLADQASRMQRLAALSLGRLRLDPA